MDRFDALRINAFPSKEILIVGDCVRCIDDDLSEPRIAKSPQLLFGSVRNASLTTQVHTNHCASVHLIKNL